MTQALLAQGIALGGNVALQNSPQTNNAFQQAFGIGGQLGILAFSRKHENEVDKMGMIFMAMAGYDPKEAIEVWKRMAAKGGGQKPPELLSTHPSESTSFAERSHDFLQTLVE
jgi:predicted Zn-dependent protease